MIDTEGSSAREGAATSASAIAAADLALIPLGPSAIEAHEAAKAVAHVRLAERRIGRAIPHAVLLTRMPAAIRPRTLRTMVEELTAQSVPILPAALVEKEAYRVMFALGWPLSRLTESHVGGLPAARGNADAFVRALLAWRERVAASKAPKPGRAGRRRRLPCRPKRRGAKPSRASGKCWRLTAPSNVSAPPAAPAYICSRRAPAPKP